jgi:hypothetical protein
MLKENEVTQAVEEKNAEPLNGNVPLKQQASK